jgi:hypothetical protein
MSEERDDPEEVMPIETRWVRDRLRLPEVAALPESPPASTADAEGIGDRVRAAAEAIAAAAGAAREEIRQRGWVYGFGSITSAVIGIAAFTVAVTVPAFQLAGVAIAVLELASIFVLRNLQRRLMRDFIAVACLEERYRKPLDEARTPDDMAKLGANIRAEMAVAAGPLPAAGEMGR